MRHLILILFVFSLVACQKVDLHHGLSEIEADEILNLLHEQNITAKKEREVSGQEVSWKVTVPNDDSARARQLLISNHLPRRRELGLSGVYKEKGLIPTPDEQKARYLLAVKGEIINSLLKIPGVVDADVILNVPVGDEFSDLAGQNQRPSASVIVRTRGDEAGQAVTEGKVQRFVANTVPNLDPNDVTVIVSRTTGGAPIIPASPTLPPGGSVPESAMGGHGPDGWVEIAGMELHPDSVGRMKGYFIGLLSLLVLVSAALLVNIVRINRLRVRLQTGAPVEPVPLEAGRRQLLGSGGEGGESVEGTFDVGKRNLGA